MAAKQLRSITTILEERAFAKIALHRVFVVLLVCMVDGVDVHPSLVTTLLKVAHEAAMRTCVQPTAGETVNALHMTDSKYTCQTYTS